MSTKYTLILDKAATEGFLMPKGFESNVKVWAWGAGGGNGGSTVGSGGSHAYSVLQINAGDFVEMVIGAPGSRNVNKDGGAGGKGNFLTQTFDGGDGGDASGDEDGGGGGGGGGGAASVVLVNDIPLVIAAGGGGGAGWGDDNAKGGASYPGDVYPGYETSVKPVTLSYAWNSFMNSYAVWGAGQDYSVDLYFPTTGTYTFNYAVDNYGSVFLDGSEIIGLVGTNSTWFTTTTTYTQTVSAGIHTIRVTGVNTGGPAGVAAQIIKPDGKEFWNTRALCHIPGLTLTSRGGAGGTGVGGGGGGGGGHLGGIGGRGGPDDDVPYGGNGGQSIGQIIIPGNGTAPGGTTVKNYPGKNYGYAENPGYIIMEFQEKFRAWTKVSGEWKKLDNAWVKVSNTWKPIKQVFVKSNGVWRPLISQSKITAGIQSTVTYSIPTPTTWTIPDGVNKLWLTLVGGGGGGGAASSLYSLDPKVSGAPGRPGHVVRGNIIVSPGDVVDIGVGGGGGRGLPAQTVLYKTPGVYTYKVPAGVTSLRIGAIGGGGGGGAGGRWRGLADDDLLGEGHDGIPGQYVRGNLAVTPGEVITIEVGQGGQGGITGRSAAGGVGGLSTLGFSGGRGGSSGPEDYSGSGGGGGSPSVIKQGNGNVAIIAAGGGGGGGGGSRIDHPIWYHVGDVDHWHPFLNAYGIWKKPFIGNHAYYVDINFPTTATYTVKYACDGELDWKIDTGTNYHIGYGNVANQLTTTVSVSAGVHTLKVKAKNIDNVGGWALQILNPDASQLWNSRYGNQGATTLSTPYPNPSLPAVEFNSNGANAGGVGGSSVTNGGGGGGGGGGFDGGVGGKSKDGSTRTSTYTAANVALPRNAWNGFFTRTIAANSNPSSTAIKEYFVRLDGQTIYQGNKVPPSEFTGGTYRGSQFGVAAGGKEADPPPAVTLTFTTNKSWVVPEGVISIDVSAVGGGGGGGNGRGVNGIPDGGSAGTVVSQTNISVTPGETLDIVVGTGGAGVTYDGPVIPGGNGTATTFKRGATTLVSAAGGAGGQSANGSDMNGRDSGSPFNGNGGDGKFGKVDGQPGTLGSGGGGVDGGASGKTSGRGGDGAVRISFISTITPFGDYLNSFDLNVKEYYGWGGYTGSEGLNIYPTNFEAVTLPPISNDLVVDFEDLANIVIGSGASINAYTNYTGMASPGIDGNVVVFGYSGITPNGEIRTVETKDPVDLTEYEQLYFEINMGSSFDWGESPETEAEGFKLQYSVDGTTWIDLDTSNPTGYHKFNYGNYWQSSYRDLGWYNDRYDKWWKTWGYGSGFWFDGYYRYGYYPYTYYPYGAFANVWLTKIADLPDEARQIGGVYLRYYQRRYGLTTTPRDTWAATNIYSVGRRSISTAKNGGQGGERWGRAGSGGAGAVYVVPENGYGGGDGGVSTLGYDGGRGGHSVLDPFFRYNPDKIYSVAFNGSSKSHVRVTNDSVLDLGSGNWTIDGWIYPTRFDAFDTIVAKRAVNTDYSPFVIGLRSGKLQTYISQTGTSWNLGANYGDSRGGNTVSIPVDLNAWSFITIQRRGDVIEQYVNGVLRTSGTLTSAGSALMTNSADLSIGSSDLNGAYPFNGYIHSFRIIKGQAVYSGEFEIPYGPSANVQSASGNIAAIGGSNVSLLTCQVNGFVDDSAHDLTISRKYNAKLTQIDPFVDSYSDSYYFRGKFNNVGAGGGGGGAASVIKINGNVIAVAAGGAGGAGALGNDYRALSSLGYVDNGTTYGGQGTNRPGSGGAAGGGGGGSNGGQGGRLTPGNRGGYAGSDGASYVPTQWTEDAARNFGGTSGNGNNGSITISFFKP